jgi:hypothetical protein
MKRKHIIKDRQTAAEFKDRIEEIEKQSRLLASIAERYFESITPQGKNFYKS